MTRKNWADMDRQQLLDELSVWTRRLQELNANLNAAGREARATGKYLPLAEFQALESQRNKVAMGVRGLERELAKKRAQKRERSFSEYFQEAADDLLGDDQYNTIYDRAKALQGQEKVR